MTSMFKQSLRALFSPRLYKIYGQEGLYEPQDLEKWSDKIIMTAMTLKSFSAYALPYLGWYIYRNGLPTLNDIMYTKNIVTSLGCLLVIVLFTRTIGRMSNPDYVKFLQDITNLPSDSQKLLEVVRKYDFDFTDWPVTYAVPQTVRFPRLLQYAFKVNPAVDMPFYKRIVMIPLAYIATHLFAVKLVYPGTFTILHCLLWSTALTGRTEIVEKFHGLRSKIKTSLGDSIDTIFIDARKLHKRGSTLVICCEGNSGFYEVGIMTTPAKANYSVLGWNHPGFLGSSGTPFPEAEHAAIDAVIQFAMDLGFELNNIVIFGWSIGGYPASWAAAHYPDIKALVLDATFDDILPLARKTMPSSWYLIVEEVIRSYINLNIGELVTKYPGKIALVRRTEDEIVCESLMNTVETNGANNIVLRLLETRHPNLAPEVKEMVAEYIRYTEKERREKAHPELGVTAQKSMNLISNYLYDYESSHCTPLPERYFLQIMVSLE